LKIAKIFQYNFIATKCIKIPTKVVKEVSNVTESYMVQSRQFFD
jgi:hypothetical protein